MSTPQGLAADSVQILLKTGVLPPAALRAWRPEHWPVAEGWQPVLDAFWSCASGRALAQNLQARLAAGAVIFPAQPLRALALTPLARVRVVVLGQDPYHGPGQAEGLAFSVPPGVRVPPSLRNVLKEWRRDTGLSCPLHQGSLQTWAAKGVLLLNTVLTVEQSRPASHARLGWEVLTDALLRAVAQQAPACVYLLWGAQAQAKAALIESAAQGAALVLQANHPSPLSALRPPRPFMGCAHFSAAQRWLTEHGQAFDWSLASAE